MAQVIIRCEQCGRRTVRNHIANTPYPRFCNRVCSARWQGRTTTTRKD